MGSILKSFVSLFGLFIVGFIVIGLILPNEKSVSVTKTISSNQEKVFSMVNDLKKWEKWSPWIEYDPKMSLSYSEPSQGKDAWYSWKGNSRVGFGKYTITNSTPNVKIETLLNYEEQAPAKGYFLFNQVANGTQVTWSIEVGDDKTGVINKIFRGYNYLIMKFFLGADFNKGLDNLEKACR
jgi:hypothetical protein